MASHKLNPIQSPQNGDCCCVRYCLNTFSIPSGYHMEDTANKYKILLENLKGRDYRISRTIRRTFFPEKCDLKSTCVLYAEGKYLFPNL